jgi:hypothetical protein
LNNVKHQIIPLLPDNPWEATLQEKPNMTEGFQWLVERLIKEALHHRERLSRTKITLLSKKLSHDVSYIPPHVLSKQTIEEFVLH